jgi:hypothetical protein
MRILAISRQCYGALGATFGATRFREFSLHKLLNRRSPMLWGKMSVPLNHRQIFPAA